MSNSLVEIANRIIRENPDKVQQARGNPKQTSWFVGQIMREAPGAYTEHDIRQVLERRGLRTPAGAATVAADEPTSVDLIVGLLHAHPGQWKLHYGRRDDGGQFVSLVDGNRGDIIDGESGAISEPLLKLLLRFPVIASEFLHDKSADLPPLGDSRPKP